MIEAIVAASKWKWHLYKADIADNSLAAKPLGTKKKQLHVIFEKGR